MAFTAITNGEIAVGESVKNSTMQKIKDNFDDLDSRVTSLSLSGTEAPIVLSVYGRADKLTIPYTDFIKTTLNYDITVTGVYILIDQAGTSGTTEVDVLFKRGVGTYTSILTTKPSVGFASGNDAISSNAVLNPTYVNLEAGDIIRLDITGAQVGGKNFLVRIDYLRA